MQDISKRTDTIYLQVSNSTFTPARSPTVTIAGLRCGLNGNKLVDGFLPPFQDRTFNDFKSPVSNMTDVALIVEGTRLFVGKQFLATVSPIFYSMFFSEFCEKQKTEIPLEDIVLDEFLELLHMVYAPQRPVTSENVECLLKLSDLYDIQFVALACLDFLCGPESRLISLAKKLRMLDVYHIKGIKKFCYLAINTAHEGRAVMATSEYEEFSTETKAAILGRIVQLG